MKDLAIAAVEEMIFDASIEERAGGTPETHIARTLVLVSDGQERIPPLEEALKQVRCHVDAYASQ